VKPVWEMPPPMNTCRSMAAASTLVAVAGDMTTAYAFLLQTVWVTMLQEGNTIGRLDIDNFVLQVDRVLGPPMNTEICLDYRREVQRLKRS